MYYRKYVFAAIIKTTAKRDTIFQLDRSFQPMEAEELLVESFARSLHALVTSEVPVERVLKLSIKHLEKIKTLLLRQ